ncbi:MAG TPA: uroporphyrinogen decarboxylase family protein [Armatimonadota bacterium]|jgi:uroporphyrinogen-III decarboxylase
MEREYYLQLAKSGLQMPIGADLILHEYADADAILEDGERLGRVLEETAKRFCTPLAVPHMDLELEKFEILRLLGIPAEERAKYHFTSPPSAEDFAAIDAVQVGAFSPRLQAHIDSVRYIATQTDLLPIGMAIGPFSLMTKLLADPITPVCMAGSGVTAEEDEEVATVEQTLSLIIRFIVRSIEAQIAAGAKAIFIAEPAANKVYFSPNQLDAGSDIFDRFVMAYNYQIRALLAQYGVDLIFHCCGELTEYMVQKFTKLDPAIMSLGSSRKLWEDAALVPDDIVLFGNLPSKKFYSDALITVEQVEQQGAELLAKMAEVGHPFILGTECDVLTVQGCEATIRAKAMVIAKRRELCCP